MKTTNNSLGRAFLLALLLLGTVILKAQDLPVYEQNSILIKFKESTTTAKAAALKAAIKPTKTEKIGPLGIEKWSIPDQSNSPDGKCSPDIEALIDSYENHPDVEYAEPNYYLYPQQNAFTPDDPAFPNQYALDLISARAAWNIRSTSSLVKVAILDTGIDTTHTDLKENIDIVNGWNIINNSSDVWDNHGHGTQVAGIIGARGNNGIGITGVSMDIQLVPVKFMDTGLANEPLGSTANAILALEYAVDKGIKISNNSWGNRQYSQALYDAIAWAGTAGHLFIVAAGNSGENGDFDNDQTPVYPASYDLDNIISVMSSNEEDELSSFSCYGQTSVDLAAPGAAILTSSPTYEVYATVNGSSFAAPHVSGAAALLLARYPYLSPLEIKEQLLNTVDPVADFATKCLSGGRLNLYEALVPDTEWPVTFQTTFGGAFEDGGVDVIGSDDAAGDVVQTPDGGYLMVGPSRSFTKPTGEIGDADILLVKVDSFGMEEWSKIYSQEGYNDQIPRKIIPTSDGNYVIAGTSTTSGNYWGNSYVQKINIQGDVVWSKIYSGSEAYDIAETADSGLVIVGGTYYHATILKLDSDGNLLFSKRFYVDNVVYPTDNSAVVPTMDGGFACLFQRHLNTGNDTWRTTATGIKFSENGDVEWAKYFGLKKHNPHYRSFAASIVQHPDGGLTFSNYSQNYYNTPYQPYFNIHLVKTTATGDVVWQKIVGGSGGEYPKDMILDEDGGYIIAGYQIYQDMFLLKIDSSANSIEWTKRFNGPGTGVDIAQAVKRTTDGGLVVAGSIGKGAAGLNDLVLIKTDTNGDIGCGADFTDFSIITVDTLGEQAANISFSFPTVTTTPISPVVFNPGLNQSTLCSSVLCDIVADFDIDYSSCSTGTLNLISNSPNATSFSWKVNGDIISQNANAIINFSPYDGRKVITFKADNGVCSDIEQIILENLVPNPNFTNHIDGLQAMFSVNADSNTLIPFEYNWAFGDGNTGTGAFVNHNYNTIGDYTVCLSISNDCTTEMECREITINNNLTASTFTKFIGNTANNGAYYQNSIIPAIDGGYIVTGLTADTMGSYDVLLNRVDDNGDLLWSQSYGGNAQDYPTDIIQADNGYIVVGATKSYHSPDNYDYYVFKSDLDGNLIWARTFGDTIPGKERWAYKDDIAYSINRTADGNYLISGYTKGGFNGKWDYYKGFLVKVDDDGNELFSKINNLQQYNSNEFYSSLITPNNKNITVGYFADQLIFWQIQVADENGNLEFRRRFPSTDGHCYDITQTFDGGFALTGYTRGYGRINRNAMIMKLDSSYNVIWSKLYGGTNNDYGRKIIETQDGGLLMIGNSASASIGASGNDPYIIKTDSEGNEEWAKLYNFGGNESANDVIEVSDGYIINGHSNNGGLGSNDIFIMKIDKNGNSQCSHKNAPVTQIPVLTTAAYLGFSTNSVTSELTVQSNTNSPNSQQNTRCESGCQADFYYNNAPACTGNTITFTNNSTAGSYQWRVNNVVVGNTKDLAYNFALEGTYTVKLIVTDNALVCSDSYSTTITVHPAASNLDLGPDIDTCEPQAELDAGEGYFSYIWDKDGSLYSNEQKPTITEAGYYLVGVQDYCGNTNTAAVNVQLGGGCVWPGDTDNDGRVDVFDLLNIGLGFGQTGTARPSATTDWEGQYCDDWTGTLPNTSLNNKYADCNGNGEISYNDVESINLNYGKTHDTYNNPTFGNGDQDIVLRPVLRSMNLTADDSYVEIGFEIISQSGNDFESYGIGYKYGLPVDTVDFSYGNSIYNDSSHVTTDHQLPGQSIHMAISKTDLTNILDQGNVGTLGITEVNVTIDSIGPLSDNATWLNLQDLRIVSADGADVEACGCDAAYYFDEGTDIDTSGVQNPDVIVLLLNACPVNCGSVSVEALGGMPPYNYQWSNGSSSPTIYQASNGLHEVTVTDAQGQQQYGYIYMNYESDETACRESFQVALEVTDMACMPDELQQTQGSLTANAYGGIPPYTYAWSTGETTATITGLNPDSYSLTVTDSYGTSITDSAEISTPFQAAMTDSTPVICATGGTATISVTGGTPPYTYNIVDFYTNATPVIFSSDPTSDTSYTFTDLPIGTYNIVVFDATDCQAYCGPAFDIIQDDQLTVELEIHDASCPDEADGSAAVIPTCGQAPFGFIWSNGETTASITGLTAATYWVTISDAAGDFLVLETEVGEPDDLFLDYAEINATTCGLDNGSVILNGYGGTMPYFFTIYGINTEYTASGQDSLFENLPADTYLASFLDTNGCTYTCPLGFVIDESTDRHALVAATETCYGLAEGSIKICDTPPFDYLVNNYNAGRSLDSCVLIDNLPGGGYDILVTDANGCITSSWIEVVQRENVHFEAVADGCTRSILVTMSSGTGPIFELSLTTYGQQGGTTQHTITDELLLENLAYGTYYLDVVDQYGCNCTPMVVNLLPPTVCSIPIFTPAFKVYPTLAKDRVFVEIDLEEMTASNVEIYNATGVQMLARRLETNKEILEVDVSNWASGAYFVKYGALEVKRFMVVR